MPIPSIAIVRLFTLGSANTRSRNISNFNHVISFSTSRSQQQWIVWRDPNIVMHRERSL